MGYQWIRYQYHAAPQARRIQAVDEKLIITD